MFVRRQDGEWFNDDWTTGAKVSVPSSRPEPELAQLVRKAAVLMDCSTQDIWDSHLPKDVRDDDKKALEFLRELFA